MWTLVSIRAASLGVGESVSSWLASRSCERNERLAKVGAGYGNRTRLTGLGSQDITTMLSPPSRGRFTISRPNNRQHLIAPRFHNLLREAFQIQPQQRFGV